MRNVLIFSLVVSILFTTTYWVYSEDTMCRYPIAYSIGEFDDQFSISREEARLAIAEAAELWEEAVGEELFTYDEDAGFTVNFVFDERQAVSDEEREARNELATIESRNISVSDQYDRLVVEFEQLRASYRAQVSQYEERLAAHNARVDEFNQDGGAPPDAFAELEAERNELADIARGLDVEVQALNQVAESVNQLSEQGNQLINEYNQLVEQYNQRFGQAGEFTQGDYQGNKIHVYTFADDIELRQVLAHELGHALALEHVDDPRAIMYYLMGTQGDVLTLTQADVDEFDRVCGDGPSRLNTLRQFVYR